MRPNLLLYTSDMQRAADFYQQLGFTLRRRNRNGGWTELEFGTLLLFLHRVATLPAASKRLEFGFEAQQPLEQLAAQLLQSGVIVSAEIVDEGFGRILQLADPDGNTLTIVEHEPELYA